MLIQKLDFAVENKPLSETLFQLSLESNVNISYGNIPQKSDYLVSQTFRDKSMKFILQTLLNPTDLDFKVIGNQIVLFAKPPSPPPKYTIRGFVEDDFNGEKLIAANVFDPTSFRGVSTNVYGFYSLTFPAGPIELTYSYLGYDSETISLDLDRDTLINISLKTALTLAEVTVVGTDSLTGNRFANLSRDDISVETMTKLPSLAGEPDVVRTSFLLPGVQSGGDGVGGLFVRGGNADQNLILLDGVTVYNASHLVGVFSIFNSSAIRSSSLTKGSFPARYGGRLSSVLDVRTKEGNKKQHELEFGMGLISSKASIEGPIVKDKSAFFFSYRRSFLDLIMKPVTRYFNDQNGVDGFSAYTFDDFNGKINFEVSDKDEIFFSFYAGGDNFEDQRLDSVLQFSYRANQTLKWGNNIGAIRWNHDFGGRLFSNTTATFSRYNFQSQNFIGLDNQMPDSLSESFFFANLYQSTIQDLAIKLDFDYLPNPAHYVRFGAGFTRHKFQPRIASVTENNEIDFSFNSPLSELDQLFDDEFIEAYEGAAYIEDEIFLRRELRLNAGLRASYFREGAKTYWSLQPRLSAQVFIRNEWTVNFSFSTMRQHLHLLTRSGIGLPTDLWVPSNDQIKPQDAWQGVLGIQYASKKNVWQAGMEAYYKKMNNVLTYQEGSLLTFIDGENWEENVAVGQGWSYGLEFFGNKTKGNTTGIMSATLAWSERQFDEISFGEKFNFRYDRRLFVKLAGIHRYSPKFELTASWVFGTGNGITLPTSVTQYFPQAVSFDFADPLFAPIDNVNNQNPFLVYEYGARNAFRMESYHRFDIACNFYFDKYWGEQKLSLGVYNLYNRRNPLYIDLQPIDNNSDNRQFVKYSLIPLLPQISYLLRIKNWKRPNQTIID